MSTDFSEAKRVAIPFLDRMHTNIKRDECMFEEKIRRKAANVVSAINILRKEARCAIRAISTLQNILDRQRNDIYPNNDIRDVLRELADKHTTIIPAWDLDKNDEDVHTIMFLALTSDVDYQREAKMRIDVFGAMLRIHGSYHPTETSDESQFYVVTTRIDFGVAYDRAVAAEHTIAVDAMARATQGLISPMIDTTAFLQRAWEDNEATAVNWVDDVCVFTVEVRVCLLVAVSMAHTR